MQDCGENSNQLELHWGKMEIVGDSLRGFVGAIDKDFGIELNGFGVS
jgi:hypothetical protein